MVIWYIHIYVHIDINGDINGTITDEVARFWLLDDPCQFIESNSQQGKYA